MSDGTRIQEYTAELECRECGEYDEVEVFFDPETGYSWWNCTAGHENSKYEDEWEEDYYDPDDNWDFE